MPRASTLPRRAATPQARSTLRERVAAMPQTPGVYRWLDRAGRVLYVGKAKNLRRRRLQSYLRPSGGDGSFRSRGLREKMADVDVTVTDTELEALVLELHLIRSLKPRYNVLLTRDSHYAFIRITTQDPYPTVLVTDRKLDDGATELGPFTNTWSQREMLLVLRRLFPFRTCAMDLRPDTRQSLFPAEAGEFSFTQSPCPPFPDGRERGEEGNNTTSVSADCDSPTRPAITIPLQVIATRKDRRTPCLDFHIGQCAGPCAQGMTPEAYRAQCIDGVLAFYRGEYGTVIDLLVGRMREAAGERKYERMKDVIHTLRFIRQLALQAKFFDPGGLRADVVGYGCDGGRMQIVLLSVRGGKIVGETGCCVEDHPDARDARLTQFLVQHYDAAPPPLPDDPGPASLVLPTAYSETGLLRDWLRGSGLRLRLDVPHRGTTARLHALAERNAGEKLALLV